MEWFLIKQNNIVFSICLHVSIDNTIDVFVCGGCRNLYYGRSIHGSCDNSHTAFLVDIFKQDGNDLNKSWMMDKVDIALSFRDDIGYMVICDIHQPRRCCCIGISLVKKESYKSKLYSPDEDLLAAITLMELKTSD